jgi:hypothetical protein
LSDTTDVVYEALFGDRANGEWSSLFSVVKANLGGRVCRDAKISLEKPEYGPKSGFSTALHVVRWPLL